MTSKKELKIAFSMAILLFVVGVFCYSAFSSTKPKQPVRIMFKCVAGNVLFDHVAHAENYDASCEDCHHEESDDEDNQSCGQCHKRESTEDVEIKRSDAFHGQCINCHKEQSGPVECSKCHVM